MAAVPSTLSPGIQVLAHRLQEAGAFHGDVKSRLQDAMNDWSKDGNYSYYINHSGDGETGDVIYSSNGDIRKAPYEIGMQGGKAVTNVDHENSVNVVPVTEYAEEADDDDHYASMTEAFKSSNIYTDLPVYERFISKGERDKADEGSFAGKGKSFPILKPGDVKAAVHAMGRAGSGNYGMAQLKANIIRIAKAKGWTEYLPKAWRGDDAKESAPPAQATELRLVESAGGFLDEIPLREARTNYPVKLISPGTGSMAHYPAPVLERDGPKVFKKGTLMFWNHPTKAEEAARPEGDLNNLAAILTQDARWESDGKQGPGLYAEAKVMADYAEKIAERAPHIGLSIRAGGTGTGKTVNGQPELKSIDYAESVDYVTKAGRGGLALAEAARNAGILEEVEMTEAEIKKLVESAVTAAVAAVTSPVKALEARALRGDAVVEANKILSPLALKESAKQLIVDNVLRDDLPLKDGAIDMTKFTERVNAEAKRVGAVLAEATGSGRVTGLGPSLAADTRTPEQIREAQKAEKKARKRLEESEREVWSDLTGLPMREVA